MANTLNTVKEDLQMLFVRSIIIGLTYYKDKLINILKDELTEEDIKELNYRKNKIYKIEIEKGILTDDQISQIRDYRRAIQFDLARILYRLCRFEEGKLSINIIEEMAKMFNIQVKIYDENKTIIYKTPPMDVQIKILFYDNKFLHISRESLITPCKLKKFKTMNINYILVSQ